MDKKYYLLISTVVIIVFLIFLYISTGFTPCCMDISLETAHNNGCKEYFVNQNPSCDDWTKVNVTFKGANMTFEKFLKDNYGCTNESCARTTCRCPGYDNP